MALCATIRGTFGLHMLASLSTLKGHQHKGAFIHSIYQSLPDHCYLLELPKSCVTLVVVPQAFFF
jgi:hypothetical protein